MATTIKDTCRLHIGRSNEYFSSYLKSELRTLTIRPSKIEQQGVAAKRKHSSGIGMKYRSLQFSRPATNNLFEMAPNIRGAERMGYY